VPIGEQHGRCPLSFRQDVLSHEVNLLKRVLVDIGRPTDSGAVMYRQRSFYSQRT
jgi:hypothetical protein